MELIMAVWKWLSISAVILILLAGCRGSQSPPIPPPKSGDTPGTTSGTTSTLVPIPPTISSKNPSSAVSPSAPIAPESPSRPLAPEFSLPLKDGSTFTLSQHRGKVVVLYFSVRDCPTCAQSVLVLSRIASEYRPQGVEVLAINLEPRTTSQEWAEYWRTAGGSEVFWAIEDSSITTVVSYRVDRQETLIIVDRTGRVAYRDVLTTTDPYDKLNLAITKILSPSGRQTTSSSSTPTPSPTPNPTPTYVPAATTTPTPPTTGSKTATASWPLAPDFSLPLKDGSTFNLSEQKGNVVVLYFAFPGCPGCGYMAPPLSRIHKELGPQGVKVVAIDIFGGTFDEWEKFWRDVGGGEVIWIIDSFGRPSGSVSKAYELTSVGTIIIIDRKGRIAYRHGLMEPSKDLFEKLKAQIEGIA